MNPIELSVIIPAYNEAKRIEPTLRATLAWLAASGRSYEVIVVDDGSTDATREVVSRLRSNAPNLQLVESRPNRGKGHVVALGMLMAKGDLRLFMDADNSTPITQLGRLEEHIRDGADLAIGSRRADGAEQQVRPPWYRCLWSRISNRVVQRALLPGIRDTQCGFKLMTANAAQTLFPHLSTAGWGFDMELLARARGERMRIDEVAVTWKDDPRTKTRVLRDTWKITREFLRIRRMLSMQAAR